MSSGYVQSGQVDKLTGYLLQLLRQVQHEVARVGHALAGWLAGCSDVAVKRRYRGATHYGAKIANVIDPFTSSLLDAEGQGIVHKHAGHLLRTKLSGTARGP
ncbi:hypothetical protein KRP22_012193 [Phytophthora ramorum]|nr:hypothetical protein KRP22_14897 [Phytophthora ramorum]